MDIRNLADVPAFITKDGSEIRELLAYRNSSIRNQSLAEARLAPGAATQPHFHPRTEEIYYILSGTGRMQIGPEVRMVGPLDAVAIPPGEPHQITNPGTEPLVFLCCCAPCYEHHDTVMFEGDFAALAGGTLAGGTPAIRARDVNELYPPAARAWPRRSLLAAGLLLVAVICLASREDARVLTLARNTLWLSVGTLAISLPVGTLLAVLLLRTDLPLRRAGLAVVGLGLFVPLYVQAGAWMAGFGLQGWYTLASGQTPWIAGLPGAIWIHAMASVPWVVLIVGAGLWLVDPDLEEQGLLDAGPGDVLAKVTLPQASAALLGAALWTLLSTAGEMTVTDLLVVRTYAEEIYTQASATGEPLGVPFRMGSGLALAALVGGLALMGISALAPRTVRPSRRARVVFRLGAFRWPWALLVVLLLAGVIGLPLANVAYKAGLVTTSGPEGFARSWSLAKTFRLAGEALLRSSPAGWRAGRVLHEIGWTALVGGLAAALAVIGAAPLGWAARRGGVRAWPAWIVAALGLAVPGTVIGVALAWLFNLPALLWLYDQAGFDLYGQSIAAPVLAQALRALPLATLVVWHALESVPESTVEVARLEGAGPVTCLVRVGLAARRPALVVAWLVALAVTTGELSASLLVAPARVELLTRWIYNQLHYGQEDQVAGVLLVMFGGYGVLAGLCVGLARGSRTRAAEGPGNSARRIGSLVT